MTKLFSHERCEECRGGCCRHITVPVATPTSLDDFDVIRWWLFHENVVFYRETKRGWMVQIEVQCSALAPDGRCDRYNERPGICSDYDPERCCYDPETKTCPPHEVGRGGVKALLETPEDVDRVVAKRWPKAKLPWADAHVQTDAGVDIELG